MTQKNPFEGITLHTRKYLNAGQLVAHMMEIGYREDDSIVKCFVANTTFPTKNFCSFSVQVEDPSKNMGTLTAEDKQTYSERYKSVRGDNLSVPMCIALMEYFIIRMKLEIGLALTGKASYIKAPLFVWVLEAYASCLVFDSSSSFLPKECSGDRFFFIDSESYHDVEDVNKDWLWISATNIQEKCA
jgi:hypothetical protein